MSSTATLRLFAVFHLNLAYSSIEEEAHADIVRLCYRPLLSLVEDDGIPLGIEATGHTIERIAALDQDWVERFRALLASGRCELVGSGHAQIIGPLVPAEVNRWNQRLGREAYRRLLGVEPGIALVNEQAYSAGMVGHYLDAGYRAIIMDWDNPSSLHPEWDPEWRFGPQVAKGNGGSSIPLLWSQSIAFQKLQRYAHGEMSLTDYLEYLDGHRGDGPRALAMYSNDAEIFDYRPGRYLTEPGLADGEWERIREAFRAIAADDRFELLPPSRVLDAGGLPSAPGPLTLQSTTEPVPVKKQGKYNITRWALTGRDDLALNTACHRICGALRARRETDPVLWRELCRLWSSDFRTHLTGSRWEGVWKDVATLGGDLGIGAGPVRGEGDGEPTPGGSLPDGILINRDGSLVEIRTPTVHLRLNVRRGLAVDRFGPPDGEGWIGTLPHGYFSDIAWGADFYTGHLVLEGAGEPKVTDLEPARPVVLWFEDRQSVEARATVETPLGSVDKRVILDVGSQTLEFDYCLHWTQVPSGRLRLGHITLNPRHFDRQALFLRTHLGGADPERFDLGSTEVDHGEAISFLVSSRQVLGMTEGWVEIGDASTTLRIEVDRDLSCVLGMLTLRDVRDLWFGRLAFSARELDDTSRPGTRANELRTRIRVRIV